MPLSGPVISKQPVSVITTLGATVRLTVTISTGGYTIYAWHKRGGDMPAQATGVVTIRDPSVSPTGPIIVHPGGGGGVTLTIPNIAAEDLGFYYCSIVQPGRGQVDSTSAFVATATAGGGIPIFPTDPTGTGGSSVTVATTAAEWTVSHGGTFATAASLGISNLVRSRYTNAPDTLTFTVAGRAVDAARLFAYGQIVTVSRSGTVFFSGVVTQTPATGSGQSEDHSYTLSNAWWHLMRMVAHQEWTVNPGGTAGSKYSGRIILGQAIDGTRQTTGQTITELLNYAKANGAPLTVGAIDPAINAPLDEVKDVTVANAIETVLRWHPDCVKYFEYAVSPPQINIRRVSNLPAISLALGAPPLSEVSQITARDDLKVSAVVIHYEVTGSSNNKPTFDIVTDAAPAGSTGKELGAMCVTIPLRGVSSNVIEQRIEVQGIRDDLTAYGQPSVRAFLVAHVGALQEAATDEEITLDGITITAVSRGLSDANANKYDPVTDSMVADDYDDSLNAMLVNGGITDWMIAKGVRAQYHTIYFSYTLDSGSGGTPGQQIDGTLDVCAINVGPESAESPASLRYQTLTNYDPGDAVPAGLAAAALTAFNRLHYSGSVTLVEAEASGLVGLGQALNLTGGTGAYATMAAMITSETVDVDRGTTTLTFGPPEHLSVRDFLALLDVARPAVGGRQYSGPAGVGTGMSDVRCGKL